MLPGVGGLHWLSTIPPSNTKVDTTQYFGFILVLVWKFTTVCCAFAQQTSAVVLGSKLLGWQVYCQTEYQQAPV